MLREIFRGKASSLDCVLLAAALAEAACCQASRSVGVSPMIFATHMRAAAGCVAPKAAAGCPLSKGFPASSNCSFIFD